MRFSTGCAALALALFSSPALADRPFDWTGFYVGAHGGYAWGDVSVVDTDGGVPYGAFDYKAKGGLGGLTAGYNLQFGVLVLGVEGDIGYLGPQGSKQIPSSDPAHHQDLTLAGGLYGDITGRVGLALGQTLLYGKAGFAFFDGEAKQATTKVWYQPTGTERFTGWTAGGGVEHALTPNLTVRVEYQHFDFGSQGGVQEKVASSLPDADDGTPVGYKFHNEHSVTVDTLKLGVNFKF